MLARAAVALLITPVTECGGLACLVTIAHRKNNACTSPTNCKGQLVGGAHDMDL